MKTRILYTATGWNLDGVWSMCQNGLYPRLRFQLLAADFICPDGVGVEDFAFLSRYGMRQDCGDCGGVDLNGDGTVTLSDLLLFSDLWLGGR